METYYKMRERYALQKWYSKGTFRLVKRHEERYVGAFGTDCEWQEVFTGESFNNWDRIMEELPEEKCIAIRREISLKDILQEP